MTFHLRLAATALVGLALVATACSSSDGSATSTTSLPAGSTSTAPSSTAPSTTAPSTTAPSTPVAPSTPTASSITPLTPGTSWQWQLSGGAVDETVLDAVDNPKKMYDIDLFANDAATIGRLQDKGITVICYMETGAWENYRPDAANYPESVLGNVVEGFPNERFVDIRQIDALMPLITARLDLAVTKGCDGIEPDLDDTYNGYDTGFELTQADQLAYNRAVADAAHSRGLSIGLKNGASEDGSFEKAMVEFTDWALNEECNAFDECAGYTVYVDQNKAVFQVEYMTPDGTQLEDFCPADNAANFDGLLKDASGSLAALPRVACRLD